MTKEEMKAYALKAGVSQSKIEEVLQCVLETWDETKTKKYLDLVGTSHKAQHLNPNVDYTESTLKQRMVQQMAGKSEAELKKEADEVASDIFRHR